MKRGYMKFDEFEFKREPKTILKETVEMINLSTFQIDGRENNNNAEKEIWTDGMPLPPCPKIVKCLNDTENDNYIHQNNDADKKNDESIENISDNEDDHLVTQINLESMNDLKI